MANDLTTEQAGNMIRDLAAFASPILVFSGGEPLIRPDVFDLARLAGDLGLKTALASNGTLIDDEAARNISAAGFRRVSISLDGADAATHDAFRQQEGSFDKAMAGLSCVQRHGVSTQVNCAIARHNATQLEGVLALAESLGVDAVHFFLLVPVGCGQDIGDEQMLGPDEVEERLTLLARRAAQDQMQIKATCAPQYYRIVHQVRGRSAGTSHGAGAGQFNVMTRGCLAGSAVCFVSHTGQVYPCGYLPVVVGDVTEQRFADIWRDAEVFRQLRDSSLLRGKCGACEFAPVCGGCRARAFQKSGDYLEEEPCCNYVPHRLRSGARGE
jgi:radical SAM protein with 4Fe4S-binding SPASM domain